MSTTFNNAVGPHVRAPQPKPGTVVTGTTTADVLSGMLAVEDGANDVDLLRRDTLSEDVAEVEV